MIDIYITNQSDGFDAVILLERMNKLWKQIPQMDETNIFIPTLSLKTLPWSIITQAISAKQIGINGDKIL